MELTSRQKELLSNSLALHKFKFKFKSRLSWFNYHCGKRMVRVVIYRDDERCSLHHNYYRYRTCYICQCEVCTEVFVEGSFFY